MDIIFMNGKINTLDDAGTTCTAVGARNGFITALGTDADVRNQAGPKTEVVDLKGAVMFPGFMEAHNHLPMYGYLTDGMDLAPANVKKMDDIPQPCQKRDAKGSARDLDKRLPLRRIFPDGKQTPHQGRPRPGKPGTSGHALSHLSPCLRPEQPGPGEYGHHPGHSQTAGGNH